MMNTTTILSENLLDCAARVESWPAYERIIHVYETDKDGVMHFSNYFRLAEEALYAGLRAQGFLFENSKLSMAMISASAAYIHPIKFAERLTIKFSCINVMRVKISFAIDFFNHELSNLAQIKLTFVLIESETRRAVPVPERFRSLFDKSSSSSASHETDGCYLVL